MSCISWRDADNAEKRLQYNRRFVNVQLAPGGKRKVYVDLSIHPSCSGPFSPHQLPALYFLRLSVRPPPHRFGGSYDDPQIKHSSIRLNHDRILSSLLVFRSYLIPLLPPSSILLPLSVPLVGLSRTRMLTGQQPPTRWKVRLNDNKPFTTLWELCWTDSAWDHGVFGDHIPDAALLTKPNMKRWRGERFPLFPGWTMDERGLPRRLRRADMPGSPARPSLSGSPDCCDCLGEGVAVLDMLERVCDIFGRPPGLA